MSFTVDWAGKRREAGTWIQKAMLCQLQNDLQPKWHKLTLTNSTEATDPSDEQHAVLQQCLCAASYKTSLLWIQSSFEGRFCLNKTLVKLMNNFLTIGSAPVWKQTAACFDDKATRSTGKAESGPPGAAERSQRNPGTYCHIEDYWSFLYSIFLERLLSLHHTPQ